MSTTTQVQLGISECAFDPAFGNLTVRGWCVPTSAYDEITVSLADATLGVANLGMPRADVHERFPELNETHSGWKMEVTSLEMEPGSEVRVQFLLEGEVIEDRMMPVKIQYDNIEAFQELNDNYEVIVEKGANVDFAKIHDEFVKEGFDITDIDFDFDAWRQWRKEVDYEKNYPKYTDQFKNNLDDKSLQHYMSMQLLDKSSEHVIMDAASSFSVFPDILQDHYALTKVWRQDMEYEDGVHGDKIGSFGSAIPLEDNCLDGITLHCSLEHFEGEEDVRLFDEAFRLLKPGGKICIIPLYMANELTVLTSPSVWLTKFKSYSSMPDFDKRAKVHIQESKKQRQIKLYDVKTLKSDLLIPFEGRAAIKIFYFSNYAEVSGCPTYALILEKL